MKQILSTLLLITTFALFMPMLPTPVLAAPVNGGWTAAEFNDFGGCPRGTYRVRKHTRTKKKVINSAIAGGVGAALGGALGGGRGALAGAGIGAGGYLTYRYVKDRHGRCVRRYA